MKLNIFAMGLLAMSSVVFAGVVGAEEVASARSTIVGVPQQDVAPAPAAHPSTPTSADLLAQALDDYRIGPSDLIEISVFQAPELSRTVRVGARGSLSLPLIGQVNAAGLTGHELEMLIARKLSETYLQDPQVSVFIKEYISQRVTVEGSVNKPGVFPITGKTTLLQAIAMAGGLDRLADTADIKVFRERKDGTKESVQYDIAPIRKGESQDPLLQTSDVVVVAKSGTRSAIKDVTDVLRDISIFGLFF